MKKLKLFIALLGMPCFAFTQNIANRLIEYKPAPGQHINMESIGTPKAAEDMPSNINSIVSLGSFGGYIVLGFEKPCANAQENPYGIDFTIFGNAFSGSSEPGVVWVMKDENHNGEADDTWYEIKGSQHFQSETIENYNVTYFKTDTRDVFWMDNAGSSGMIKANSYNTQEYYPNTEYFPTYSPDSIAFDGTLLAPAIDSSNPNQFVIKPFDFGYADAHPRKQGMDLTVPDNPYTSEVEGAGGDPIDISWAVDGDGNYVNLDSIHFIKIVTGNLANVGWLGEISTDISYIVDVEGNNNVSGENKLLVVYNHKPKIVVGKTLQLEAIYFEKGKQTESTFAFSSQNTQVATVNPSGMITAKNAGNTKITISSNGKSKTTEITVVAPDSIEILSDFSSVYVGDTILLQSNVYDNNGDKMNTEVLFHLDTPGAGNIIEIGGKFYFVAKEKGNVTLNLVVEELEKDVSFKILSESDLIHVYFTAKTENENLIPLQKIEVKLSDLNSFVENRKTDYSCSERHSLADAVISGLQKTGINFYFRDDESPEGKLYLYSVEKNDEYTYGWGGKTSPAAFAKAWIATVNSSQYLNNFDKVELSESDTIILYHVSDIMTSWVYTRMIPDKDSAGINDEIEITLQQSTCSFSDSNISVTTLIPIQNKEILGDGISYYSDELGKGMVSITSLPMTISSGNDAVLISKQIITSSHDFTAPDIRIYPNPADKEIIVNGQELYGKQMYIFDMNGKYIRSESAFSSSENIDIQNFHPGIYMLKIVDESGVKIFKFIKK